MSPEVLGLSGKMGVGKTTVAEIMQARGMVDRVLAFADPVKAEAAYRFGFNVQLCYGAKDEIILHQDLPGGAMSVRRILQWWGNYRRLQDRQHWVKELQKWMLTNRPHILVVGDVRFREEVAWVKRHSGKLFRIEPYPEWQPGEGSKDVSETELDNWFAWDQVFRPEFGALERVAEDIAGYVKPRSAYV